MSTDLDRRLHAYRPDLADARLEGRVAAARFTAGTAWTISVGAVDLRCTPAATGGIDTQLLFGEPVTCFDVDDDLAWVRNERDGYVGYVSMAALAASLGPATHEVAALRTFVYPEPDMKTPPRDALTMTSLVGVLRERDGYAEIAGGGWVFGAHLTPIGQGAPDHVETALRFQGLPYRWGGRTSDGLDCSALVQAALCRAGVPCPRDSDQQAASVGVPVPDGAPIERSDLLYFPGHVAIALDAETVVHATAHTMLVCTEPLAAVAERVRLESGRGMTAHRRITP